jgi:Lysozyme like domain
MASPYTYAQLEQLWINNGGSKATAPIAAAIALAESSGNPQAVNPTDNNGTQTSWGLWQISNGTHGQPVPNILDPNVNAQQAVAKYQGAGGWSPWGTYDSGAYEAYLSPGTTPDPNVPAATLTSATGGGTSDCLVGPFPHTSWCLLSKSEARALLGGLVLVAGGVVAGVGLALIAVFALNRAGVSQTIVNLTPAGKALNAPMPKAPAPPKPPGPRSPAQGRHTKTGPNAPAQGRHAAPAPKPAA